MCTAPRRCACCTGPRPQTSSQPRRARPDPPQAAATPPASGDRQMAPLGACHVPAGDEVWIFTCRQAQPGHPALDFQHTRCWPYTVPVAIAMGTPRRPQSWDMVTLAAVTVLACAAGAGPIAQCLSQMDSALPSKAAAVPCPRPCVLGGGCISLRASYPMVQEGNGPHKRAVMPGALQGHGTGDTQGPFPGGRMG